jgi:AraC-like DNA-binding protein
MYAAGTTDTATIAAELGVNQRTVCRYLIATGARAKKIIGDVRYVRADVLLDEGMPATWVAAETGIPYPSLLEHAHRRDPDGRRDATREWKRAWGSIKASPDLLALHWEIAPPSAHDQRISRAA